MFLSEHWKSQVLKVMSTLLLSQLRFHPWQVDIPTFAHFRQTISLLLLLQNFSHVPKTSQLLPHVFVFVFLSNQNVRAGMQRARFLSHRNISCTVLRLILFSASAVTISVAEDKPPKNVIHPHYVPESHKWGISRSLMTHLVPLMPQLCLTADVRISHDYQRCSISLH